MRDCLRRFTPILRGVREEVDEGSYTLVLEFETKKDMTMEMWTDRLDKIESFFGPGITAKVKLHLSSMPRCTSMASPAYCCFTERKTRVSPSQRTTCLLKPVSGHFCADGSTSEMVEL